MRNLIIKLFLFSFIFSQTNSIDIATTGSNKLRMHGQLNVFHNPATMGYHAKQSHIDTLNSNVDTFLLPCNRTNSTTGKSLKRRLRKTEP